MRRTARRGSDPAAPRIFRDLLDGSGIEPPDTDQLAWGSVMGFEEARVREQVANGIAATVSGEPPTIDPDGARSALEPTLWLLEQGNDGIGRRAALTAALRTRAFAPAHSIRP